MSDTEFWILVVALAYLISVPIGCAYMVWWLDRKDYS